MLTADRNLRRMRQCELDLRRNGIDLPGAGERATRRLVRRHMDYFQLMLGYHAPPGEIVARKNAAPVTPRLAARAGNEPSGTEQLGDREPPRV